MSKKNVRIISVQPNPMQHIFDENQKVKVQQKMLLFSFVELLIRGIRVLRQYCTSAGWCTGSKCGFYYTHYWSIKKNLQTGRSGYAMYK